jgi:hypothetical protein
VAGPKKLNLYWKYDVLYDIDKEVFHNGMTIGFAAKLPWDIGLPAEVGIGLDAKRKTGPGVQIAIGFIITFML